MQFVQCIASGKGRKKKKIGNSQRSQVVVQSAGHSHESSTLSFVVECMTNFKARGDCFGLAVLIRHMENAVNPWMRPIAGSLGLPQMAELFIRNYPTEAENESTGKDTLPISATVTRRIWLKAYWLAGQPVATWPQHSKVISEISDRCFKMRKDRRAIRISLVSQEHFGHANVHLQGNFCIHWSSNNHCLFELMSFQF